MNRIELLIGRKFRTGDVVWYQALAGNTVKAIVACQTLDGVNRYGVIPFRQDGTFNPKDNVVYVNGRDLV